MDPAIVLSILALTGTICQSVLKLISKIKKSNCCGNTCVMKSDSEQIEEVEKKDKLEKDYSSE